ncbi:MAG: tetratricopeptide repeat protein [Planctomycetota bacterium]
MQNLALLILWAVVLAGAPAFGQESQPATSAPAGDQATPDALISEIKHLTLEEVVEKAYRGMEKAETGGPEARTALERTIQLISAIRQRDPINNDADFLAGRGNILLGRKREAIGLITSYASSRKGENDWLAFRLLGDLYYEAKYYTMARDKYQRATDLNPRRPEPHAGLAEAELALGRPYKAVEAARRAIELDTPAPPSQRNPKYYAALAKALQGDRKLDEASEAVGTALEIAKENAKKDPTSTPLLAELDAYNALLEQIIGSVITTFPERTEEYARLARVQTERATVAHLLSLHRVLATLERGIERSASTVPPALLLEKARLLLAVGNTEEAAQVLTDLLTREPNNADAQQLLTQIAGAPTAAPVGP